MIGCAFDMIFCNKPSLMPSHPSISASLAKGLIDFTQSQGVEKSDLLAGSKLEWETLNAPNARIGLRQYKALVTTVQVLSGDPSIPLRWAASVDMSELSIVGLIMNSAATMGDAFQQMQRYSSLVLETPSKSAGPALQLEASPNGVWVIEQRDLPFDFPELTEMSFARLTCGPRRFLDRPHILEVHFSHESLGYDSVYEQVFACPVTFGRKRNAMRIHPDTASWPVATQPDYVHGILTDHADKLLEQTLNPDTVSERVTRYLATHIHTGEISADRVAFDLGMSRQTLYRRLAEEETGFRALIQSVRLSLAKEHLSKGRSVAETAYLLGYSDAAAFSRAYKRLTGRSPKS